MTDDFLAEGPILDGLDDFLIQHPPDVIWQMLQPICQDPMDLMWGEICADMQTWRTEWPAQSDGFSWSPDRKSLEFTAPEVYPGGPYGPTFWHGPAHQSEESSLSMSCPQGSATLQLTPSPLHEGEAKSSTLYPSSSNVDPQDVKYKRRERSNSSRKAVKKTRSTLDSATPDAAVRPRKRRKRTRRVVFPAEADNGGSCGQFQVAHVGLEIYQPLEINGNGRIPPSKRKKTGKKGEGEIRGVCSYGRFEGGWTEE